MGMQPVPCAGCKPFSDASATCSRERAPPPPTRRGHPRPQAPGRPLRQGASRRPAPRSPAASPARTTAPGATPAAQPRTDRRGHEAPLPDACPECGGPLDETHVAQQFQVEIPRKAHPPAVSTSSRPVPAVPPPGPGAPSLQTSDALGAAASQLGPDAQAAVVELNKQAACRTARSRAAWRASSASPQSRRQCPTPSCGPRPAASRSTRPSARAWGNPTGLCPMRPAGGWAGSPPGCMRWSARRPRLTSSTRPAAAPWPRPSWGSTTTAP